MRQLITRRGVLRTALAAAFAAVLSPWAAAADGPFEEVEVSARIQLQERDGKVIRVKSDLYRIEVVDPKICNAFVITPREISLIAMRKGSTDITFWCNDAAAKPTKIRVTVVRKPKKKK